MYLVNEISYLVGKFFVTSTFHKKFVFGLPKFVFGLTTQISGGKVVFMLCLLDILVMPLTEFLPYKQNNLIVQQTLYYHLVEFIHYANFDFMVL